MERALIECAVAHVAEGDFLLGFAAFECLAEHLVLVLGGKREPGAHGGLGGDDPVPAEEPVGAIEHVHRSALALGASGDLAEHLGHACLGGHAACKRVPVISVRGDDRIIGVHATDGADGDGFLPGVDVAEPADLGLLVGLHGAVLELTDELHIAEPFEEDFLGKISCILRGRGEPVGLRICFRGGHGLLALDSGLRHVRVPDDVIYTW